MFGRRKCLVFILILCCLGVSGCWDRKEIQERNFVLAVGLDLADQAGLDDKKGETVSYVEPLDVKRYRLSLQVLKLGGTSGSKAGNQSGSGGGSKTFVLSNTGDSIFEMVRDMLGQSSRGLYFEHIQTIIISQAVLEQTSLQQILDFFRRDGEMRWRIRVYVTSSKAEQLLEFKPPTGEPGGIYFAGIARNQIRDPQIGAVRTDLGFLVQNMDNEADIVIPRLELEGNVAKVSGSALFKKDKFIGYQDEYWVKGIRLLRGNEKSALVTIPNPDNNGELSTFELFVHETKLEPHVSDGQVYFTLDINMAGNVAENIGATRLLSEPQFLRRIEKLVAEEIKRNVQFSLRSAQNLGVDYMHFKQKLQAHYPKEWEKLEPDWEQIMPNISLLVSVNVRIREVGTHE